MRFNILDLAGLIEGLGPHYDPVRRDNYTLPCSICGEQIGQEANECPSCQTPTVWRSSQMWKLLYGHPHQAILRLTRPAPDDDDSLGQELLDKLNISGFANLAQKNRWDRARKKLKSTQTGAIIETCFQQHQDNRKAILPHLLNWMEKAVRVKRPETKRHKQSVQAAPPIPEV